MKKITFLLLAFAFINTSCGGDDECQICTGTVTNTGEIADWTICDNAENVIRTNNVTGTSETIAITFPEAVAFFQSTGLDCE